MRAFAGSEVSTVLSLGLGFSPCQKRIESRAERLAPFGEPVLDLRRHLMVHEAGDDAVRFHLPELLDQHLLRDGWDGAFEVGKALKPTTEQVEQDHQLPSPLQHMEGGFDAAGGRHRRVRSGLTLG